MRKALLTLAAMAVIFYLYSCKKSSSTSSEKTVQNLSGSYHLTGLVWTSGSITANVYDSLPECEKDNIIKLNTDLTADFIDGVPVCDPNETDHGNWSLSANGDSLYLGSSPAFIKSWDGKTLVLTGIVDNGPPVITGTTTLKKQ